MNGRWKQLYRRVVPETVQAAEGMRNGEYACRSPILGWWQGGSYATYVLLERGEVRGAVQIVHGSRGNWLQPWCDFHRSGHDAACISCCRFALTTVIRAELRAGQRICPSMSPCANTTARSAAYSRLQLRTGHRPGQDGEVRLPVAARSGARARPDDGNDRLPLRPRPSTWAETATVHQSVAARAERTAESGQSPDAEIGAYLAGSTVGATRSPHVRKSRRGPNKRLTLDRSLS